MKQTGTKKSSKTHASTSKKVVSKITKLKQSSKVQKKPTSSSSASSSRKPMRKRGGAGEDGKENVLYLGAGGGGDTTAAMIRALADNDNGIAKKFVMGAGYKFPEDYEKAFKDGSNKRGTDGKDRFSVVLNDTKDLTQQANTYLANTLEKDEKYEIYKFKTRTFLTNNTDTDESFFESLIPDEAKEINGKKIPPAQQKSGFKIKTLLEERTSIRYLKSKYQTEFSSIEDNLYMFRTVDSFDVTKDVVASFEALKHFIKTKGITKVVVMDFGGDIFDYKKITRDTGVLAMLLYMIKHDAAMFKLDIEVYGPGCDTHATVAETKTNMMKAIGDLTPVTGESPLMSMAQFLFENSEELLKYEILGEGRATGNFVKAYVQHYNPEKPANLTIPSKYVYENDTAKLFSVMDKWLFGRPEIKDLKGKMLIDQKVEDFLKSNASKNKDFVKHLGDLNGKNDKKISDLITTFEKMSALLEVDTTRVIFKKDIDPRSIELFNAHVQQLKGDAKAQLVQDLSDMYTYTVQGASDSIFGNLLKNNVFEDAMNTLYDNAHHTITYKKRDYVSSDVLKKRFDAFRNGDLMKHVQSFENHKDIGEKLHQTFFPAPPLQSQTPFSYIAENYSTVFESGKNIDAIHAHYGAIMESKKMGKNFNPVFDYFEANRLMNPALNASFTSINNSDPINGYLRWEGLKNQDNNKTNTKYPNLFIDYADFVLIINQELPIPELTDTRSKAGMGLVHLLALPKHRKYNVLGLNKNDIPLLQNMKLAVAQLFTPKNDGEDEKERVRSNKVGIIDVLLRQIKLKFKFNDDTINSMRVRVLQQNNPSSGVGKLASQMTKGVINNELFETFIRIARDFLWNPVTFEFFFHGHPDHSVGYLHMHCVSSGASNEYSLRTSNIHDHKNIQFEDAINILQTIGQQQEGGKRKTSAKKVGLEKLTVAELADRAKAKGVVHVRQYKKDQLVAILRGEIKVPRKKPVKK